MHEVLVDKFAGPSGSMVQFANRRRGGHCSRPAVELGIKQRNFPRTSQDPGGPFSFLKPRFVLCTPIASLRRPQYLKPHTRPYNRLRYARDSATGVKAKTLGDLLTLPLPVPSEKNEIWTYHGTEQLPLKVSLHVSSWIPELLVFPRGVPFDCAAEADVVSQGHG